MNGFVEELQQQIDSRWATIKAGNFWKLVLEKPVTKPFYHDLMIELYHYTSHNSVNQAIAAFSPAPDGLLKFVYHHAAEELGHEKMVTHDLESIDMLDSKQLKRPPLPATEALIGYLYYVALKYGPAARLGYSFWAENVYDQIDEVLAKIRKDLKLSDKNMSFFVAHAKIDAKHYDEVENAINKFVSTDEERQLVKQVADTTLFLTGQMLEQLAHRHSAESSLHS